MRRIGLLAVLLALGATLAGTASGARSAAAVSGTFVGRVAHTGALVAVVAAPASGGASRGVFVYVCDGKKVSVWFPGASEGNSADLVSRGGAHAHVTLAADRAAGTVELPGAGTVSFAAPRASGAAGLYLMRRSLGHVQGVSGTRTRLDATVDSRGGAYAIRGTVKPSYGAAIQLRGSGRFFGSLERWATWIVAADGTVAGKGEVTNTAGGGNCSIWQKIKQIMSGVWCGFL